MTKTKKRVSTGKMSMIFITRRLYNHLAKIAADRDTTVDGLATEVLEEFVKGSQQRLEPENFRKVSSADVDYTVAKGVSTGYGVQCPKCGKIRELADINLVGKVYCPNCGERLDNRPETLVEIVQ